MPIAPNPYGSGFPPIYLQNFAFDYGPYHFICLDFCSRRDFDNIAYDIPPSNNVPIFGYADLHDGFTNGTLDWLNGHLASLSHQQRQNIILFTHHPPVYELQIFFIPLDGDNTFAFTEDEYNALRDLLDTYGCNIIHWFAGHYHLEGSDWVGGTNMIQWYDNGDVSIIPSTMVCSSFGGFDIPENTPVTINSMYSGLVQPNPTGCIAIVHVNVPEPINTCYVDFTGGVNTCQPCGIVSPYEPNGGIDWANSRAVMKIEMANHQALEMKIEVNNPGGDWLLNIGNSPSNNGAGGDGRDFSNDSELDITGDGDWKLSVYGNDYSIGAGIPRPLLRVQDFLGANAVNIVRVKIGDKRLWIKSEPSGNEAVLLDNEYISRLGASDSECNCVDYQYYAAFNRTIGDSRRTGNGVTKVIFLWSSTWTWGWEIP